MPRPSLKTSDVAKRLNCSTRTVQRYVHLGLLPAWKFQRSMRFSEDDVEALLANCRVSV